MSNTILEAKAVISAEDKTGAAFAAIEAKLSRLSKTAGDVSRASQNMARVTNGIGSAGSALERSTGMIARHAQTMRNVGRFAGALETVAAPVAAAKAAHLASAVKRAYAEYDDTRRYQAAILGINEQQQKVFTNQADKIASSTGFGPNQVLASQLSLANRGVDASVIPALVEKSVSYAQAMGVSLPDAVKTLEGILFSTGKHITNSAEGLAMIQQTVDRSVKLAKIGGLEADDVKQLYKYGGSSSATAGLSDNTVGAMAAAMRRANIRGDEAGVALRAISSKLVSPTAKGLTALDAMGIKYNDFVRMPGNIGVQPYANTIARTMGKKLSAGQVKSLGSMFADEAIVGNREAFISGASDVVGQSFARNKKGKLAAKDQAAIAKVTGDFYRMMVASVDTEGLLRAIIKAKPTLAQANAMFTSQQGGRALIALGDHFGEFHDKLSHVGPGFAKQVGDARTEGFKGALDRFNAATELFETKMGKAFDPLVTPAIRAAADGLNWFSALGSSAHLGVGGVGAVALGLGTFNSAMTGMAAFSRLAGGSGGFAETLAASSGARWAMFSRLGMYGLAAGAGVMAGQGLQAVGSVAAGRFYTPKDATALNDLKEQLDEVETKMKGIRDNSKMPEVRDMLLAPLASKAADLRNRIGLGEASGAANNFVWSDAMNQFPLMAGTLGRGFAADGRIPVTGYGLPGGSSAIGNIPAGGFFPPVGNGAGAGAGGDLARSMNVIVEGTVKGEGTLTINAGSELISVAKEVRMVLAGRLNNTGRSMPEVEPGANYGNSGG